MQRSKRKAKSHISLSLSALFNRAKKKRPARTALHAVGFLRRARAIDESVDVESTAVSNDDLVSLMLEFAEGKLENELSLNENEQIVQLSKGRYSARLTIANAMLLSQRASVQRIQTKKRKTYSLKVATIEAGLKSSQRTRDVSQTGKNVIIGIIDSGFDLNHPMFYDANGRLRVRKLLDQTVDEGDPKEYSRAQLKRKWEGKSNPDGPGGDEDGHGTHVATIAGGSKHRGYEGVAPDAEFLLVKTNLLDTDNAVNWIFENAGRKPCVINMSLGTHWGGHDGSSQEERFHEEVVGPGKIIVVAAGNEREDRIHVGGRFVPNQTETFPFTISSPVDLDPDTDEAASIGLTFWHDSRDEFEFELLKPSGEVCEFPNAGITENHSDPEVDIDLGRVTNVGDSSAYTKVQIEIKFPTLDTPIGLLTNWRLRVKCVSATIGRLDGWIADSSYGEFSQHPFIEESRTIGVPATGRSCIAVASYVSDSEWSSDEGDFEGVDVLEGRISPFSSRGPTRDDRQKPEISAPGQFITAGLAKNSLLSDQTDIVQVSKKLATLEGTSMSAPMVAGAIALMMQKKKDLTTEEAIDALTQSAVIDPHTGAAWNPSYGFGKLDIAKAIDSL
jgi:subtilisin family serine protease